MMNINIGIKRWSSHETSHTSMSEIYEVRVHSSNEKLRGGSGGGANFRTYLAYSDINKTKVGSKAQKRNNC